MSLMHALPARRPTTIALFVAAGLSLLIVVLALTNPWRLTAFYPVDTTGGMVATVTLTCALIAAAVLLARAGVHTGRRALIGPVVAVVAVPAVGVGVPLAALGGALRDRQISHEQVLATSPGGGYSAVALTYPDGRTEVRLRSRSGLASRESATALARCPHDPFGTDLPPESVHFTDDDHVAIPSLPDGVSMTVTFDHHTLAADQTIDMCGN
jgi:hypothetical protein